METPIALNIKPINAPHQELAWKPLGDMDYQMLDWFPMGTKYNIQMLKELRAQHMEWSRYPGNLGIKFAHIQPSPS